MQPKIGYLIDENAGWDDKPSWQFHTEADVPQYRLKYGRTADSRLTSAWYGANKGLKTKALELAVEMADAA